jgi:dipeptidyl aminopeptidase/acylaminoacyl peptidase
MSTARKLVGSCLVISLMAVVYSGAPAALGESPSGSAQRVALIALQGNPLSTVWPDGTHGQDLRQVGMPTDARHMDWSPDGAQLVFESDQADDETGDLWVVDADGTHARRFLDAQENVSFDYPAWSPDGRSIAYVRFDLIDGHQPGSIIEVVDIGSMRVTTAARTTKPDFFDGVRWSPDSTELVADVGTYLDFEHSNDTSASRLAIVKLGDPTHALRFLETVDGAAYPDWHPSGDRILFQAGWHDQNAFNVGLLNLYTVRPDGTDVIALTRFGASDPVVWMPTWSADGSSILVTLTDRVTGDHTIARLKADGTGLEPLPGPVFGAHPRQSRGTLLTKP